MASVFYVPADADATFQFHGASGELFLVSHENPLSTGDPGVISYLDQCPFVKRDAKAKPAPAPTGDDDGPGPEKE